ncbi:hypothetical protein Angca_001414, partial [Angiostrongylus cantonensis]
MSGIRPGQHAGGQSIPSGSRGTSGQPPPPYRAPTPMVGFNTTSMMQPGMSMHPGMGQMRGQSGGAPMQQQQQPAPQQQQ